MPQQTKRRVLNQTEESILLSLARDGTQSRADLARRLGVMRSTVGTRVNNLMSAGLIRQQKTNGTAPAQQGVGRPPAGIELNPDYCRFVGVDFGVGYVRAVLTDLQCRVLRMIETEIPPVEQTPDRMADLLQDMVSRVYREFDPPTGISIAVPGIVRKDGVVVRLPLIGWRNVAFKAMLDERFGWIGPIEIENDANVFARGELLTGNSDLGASTIFFWLDSGIGAGIALNGALHTGARGLAGEVGHMYVRSPSGNGTERLDDVAGKLAVVARCRQAGFDVETVEDLIQLFHAGTPGSAQVFDDWTEAMAEALSSLVSVFDANALIFAGPLTRLMRVLQSDLSQRIEKRLIYGSRLPRILIRNEDTTRIATSCVVTMRERVLTRL